MIEKINRFRHYLPIMVLAAGIIFVFLMGMIAGKAVQRQQEPEPEVKYIEREPDREYLEKYHVAGQDDFIFVLHREYLLDAEFIIDNRYMIGEAVR